jgi:hypothetical protein
MFYVTNCYYLYLRFIVFLLLLLHFASFSIICFHLNFVLYKNFTIFYNSNVLMLLISVLYPISSYVFSHFLFKCFWKELHIDTSFLVLANYFMLRLR